MQLLKVYQIYFKEEQKELLEAEYTPYYNEECSVYFENQVIKNLITADAHTESEYFGIVSYKLREKIGVVMKERWANRPNIANHSLKEFTPALFETEIESHRPDVMSFQRHPGHDSVGYANQFHPNFSKYFTEIMIRIGIGYAPVHLENVFYCNYFAAKSEIYEKYVKEMLAPAMEVMNGMPELMGNSNYPNALVKELGQRWGISHYPYHAFLCERMFSYFAHINKLNCLHF